jgi:hypothetical protein
MSTTDMINWEPVNSPNFNCILTNNYGVLGFTNDEAYFSTDLINWEETMTIDVYKLVDKKIGLTVFADDCQKHQAIEKKYSSGFIPNNLPTDGTYLSPEFYNISTNGEVYVTSSYTTGYLPDVVATDARYSDPTAYKAESFICVSKDGIDWEIVSHIAGVEGGWGGSSPDYVMYNCYIDGKFCLYGEEDTSL